MAKKSERKPVSEAHTDTVIYDNHGNEVVRFGFENIDYEEDGSITTVNTAENFEAPDGTIISPADTERPSKETRLQRCDICYLQMRRNPSQQKSRQIPYSHAVTMKRCYTCHRNMCSRHHIKSTLDNRIRCRRCHWFHRIFMPLFFRRIEDES